LEEESPVLVRDVMTENPGTAIELMSGAEALEVTLDTAT